MYATIVSMLNFSRCLCLQLKEVDDLAEYRRRTNCSVGISVFPATTEMEIQTDRWKPQGLILRQRNGVDRMPQRYLGKASVMIACPELSKLPSPRDASLNQEVTTMPSGREGGSLKPGASSSAPLLSFPETDEMVRPGSGFVEMNIYPSARVGGRQIKTSHAGARPKALSKLFLSSDGISQRYTATSSPQQAFGPDEIVGASSSSVKRPVTTL
jgi:hypothetical protein